MSFCVTDELEHFEFRDVGIMSYEKTEDGFQFVFVGAVAKYNLSANETLRDRFCSDMTFRLCGAEIEEILLEGYKYYDANDRLVETKPDEPIETSRYDEIMAMTKGATLFELARRDDAKDGAKRYLFIVDTDEETTYCITIKFEKSVASWEHMMNTV